MNLENKGPFIKNLCDNIQECISILICSNDKFEISNAFECALENLNSLYTDNLYRVCSKGELDDEDN